MLFATVETDASITGYGLTRGSQRYGLREFINREVAPFLRDKNPLETERIWHQLYKQFNPRAQTGMWSSAVSAIDIALWDIKGNTIRNRSGDCSAARRTRCKPMSPSASNNTLKSNWSKLLSNWLRKAKNGSRWLSPWIPRIRMLTRSASARCVKAWAMMSS
ncbi:MAG TPA: hypothetical protein VGW77_38175 [Candidatus Binatia bacterium]|nr:hypothetical protein [Candidatus Binatia bacterium]